MDFVDLKTKSANELKELLVETQALLHKLRQEVYGRQLKQVHKIAEARTTIARIKTILPNAS